LRNQIGEGSRSCATKPVAPETKRTATGMEEAPSLYGRGSEGVCRERGSAKLYRSKL
jgi:hypothetical protein